MTVTFFANYVPPSRSFLCKVFHPKGLALDHNCKILILKESIHKPFHANDLTVLAKQRCCLDSRYAPYFYYKRHVKSLIELRECIPVAEVTDLIGDNFGMAKAMPFKQNGSRIA